MNMITVPKLREHDKIRLFSKHLLNLNVIYLLIFLFIGFVYISLTFVRIWKCGGFLHKFQFWKIATLGKLEWLENTLERILVVLMSFFLCGKTCIITSGFISPVNVQNSMPFTVIA
jgi:hypothetical protein